MKKNLTEIVFILDRSGSMAGLEKDTIGGFNSMLVKQKKEEGDAIVTTVLFDHEYELLHDRMDIKGVSLISEEQYYVRGTTALLDAIGKTINKIQHVQKQTLKEARADKVLFIITTDGLENASKEYSHKKIKEMIQVCRQKMEWEFLFLGANMDAVSEAEKFGIDESKAAQFNNDEKGISLNYEVLSEAITEFRTKKTIDRHWKTSIDEDLKQRQ